MKDSDLLDRLAQNDRYRASQPLPPGWSEEATLDEVNRWIAASDAVEPVGFDRGSGRGARRAVAVFTLVIAVVAAVGAVALWRDSPTVRTPAAITADSAVDVAQAFFAAYDDGDVAGIVEMLAIDAEIQAGGRLQVTGTDNEVTVRSLTPEGSEPYWTFSTAAEAQVTDVMCTAAKVFDAETGDLLAVAGTAVVVCEYQWADALITALGAEPALQRSTMTVTSDGISVISFELQTGPFREIGPAFHSWLFATGKHDDFPSQPPSTNQEAHDAGRLWAKYAKEWAAFLEEHGCSYGTECFRETPATAGQ